VVVVVVATGATEVVVMTVGEVAVAGEVAAAVTGGPVGGSDSSDPVQAEATSVRTTRMNASPARCLCEGRVHLRMAVVGFPAPEFSGDPVRAVAGHCRQGLYGSGLSRTFFRKLALAQLLDRHQGRVHAFTDNNRVNDDLGYVGALRQVIHRV
jgi:hypothetical protein